MRLVVRGERLPSRIGLEAEQLGRGEVAHDVEVAPHELERLAALVLVERPAHAVEVRKAGTKVAVVPDDRELLATLPPVRRELERSGPARMPRGRGASAAAFADRAERQHREDA